MRAIVIERFGGPDCLVYTDLPDPEPLDGHVVIAVKAFGINHAEMHMRRGEWAEAAKVSGIECVGLVKACPGGEFPVGAKVAALMGGLGRTINSSYAEYTRAPVANVALIESDLPWEQLAVIPETYATAWTCLFRNLERLPDLLRELRLRNPGLPAVRRSPADDRRAGRGRPAQGPAVARVPLRGGTRGAPRDGGERGRRKDGGPRRGKPPGCAGKGLGVDSASSGV
jgi:hypothetical protein